MKIICIVVKETLKSSNIKEAISLIFNRPHPLITASGMTTKIRRKGIKINGK